MGDLYPYATDHRLVVATIDGGDRQLVHLDWSNGRRQTVHALWLRDQCACNRCRHPASLERILDQKSYGLDIFPALVSIDGGQRLFVAWAEGDHISVYAAGWLRHGGRPPIPPARRRPWGAELADGLPRFDFRAVMSRDDALLGWLEVMRETGLAYVEDAPTVEGTVGDLVRRVAYVRETNFGTVFDVVALAESISNAYTSVDLPLHVDLPAREYQPGLQLLHCLSNQTGGGASLYCDGLRLAEKLRADDPAAFDLLARTPVVFRYHDENCDYQMAAPLIGLSENGEVREIRFNPSVMTTADCPPTEIREFHRAYRHFMRLTRDPELLLEWRMQAGDIAVFDNRRVLHGRRAFEAGGGRRHLQGAYLEWEDVESKIRVLRRKIR
jgi:gamma-butyrobetaine dioxygenase